MSVRKHKAPETLQATDQSNRSESSATIQGETPVNDSSIKVHEPLSGSGGLLENSERRHVDVVSTHSNYTVMERKAHERMSRQRQERQAAKWFCKVMGAGRRGVMRV